MNPILIVDDDRDSAELMARLLQLHGFATSCVASGEAALHAVENALPALVILDAMMPGMDGIEVLRHLRSDPKTQAVPVVMYTAVSDESYRQHALSKGADDYWVKARFDFAQVKARIEQLLTRRSASNPSA